MQKKLFMAHFVMGCIFFVITGCAKNEMVKQDKPLTSTVSAAESSPKAPSGSQPASEDAPDKRLATQIIARENAADDELVPVNNASEIKAALEEIYFNFDSYALSEKSREILVINAEKLKNAPKLDVKIEGHCDERGSAEYNLALGEKRAKSAKRYMVTMGIPEERLSVISYGEEKPVATGHDETAWAKNRRDDFVITAK